LGWKKKVGLEEKFLGRLKHMPYFKAFIWDQGKKH
jgi:hypothetical protein